MLPELAVNKSNPQTQSTTEEGRSVGQSLRIPELDGIRGIAILMVVIWHYMTVVLPGTESNALFFVLSGFLIGGILLDNQDSINYFKVFYIRRFYRIIPLYAAWLLLFIVVATVISRVVTLPDELVQTSIPFWTYLIFLQNFASGWLNSFGAEWLGVTWSLAIEEQFYLTLPLFLYLVPKKRLPVILSVLIVGVVILRRLHLAIFWKGLATYVLMPYRADALLLGVLCAWMLRQENILAVLMRYSRWLYIPLIGFGAWSYRLTVAHTGDMTSQAMAFYGYSIFALMYTFLLLIAVTEQRGPIKFITRLAPLRFLGLLAYGIYLFHQAINILMHHFILHQPRAFDSPITIGVTLLSFGVTLLLAYLSWIYFEKPLVAIGHRYKYIKRESSAPSPNEATAPALAE